MTENEALQRMVAPGARKATKWLQGVIQIWVTRACDKACFGCTQNSQLKGTSKTGFGYITLENFEKAVISLKSYHGVVGVFGGNPAMHPQFEELCDILIRHIPFYRRGLWSNNPLGKAAVMRKTFNSLFSNLNVHLDEKAYKEFKTGWPECQPVGLTRDSRHSPVHGSMLDLTTLPGGLPNTEENRWRFISACDYNHQWSGMFYQFRGELRFNFCEIAGAQSILNQDNPEYPDTGFIIENETGKQPWQWSMPDYANQVRFHCQRCLGSLKGHGELAQSKDGTEQTTASNAALFVPKQRERLVQLVTTADELHPGKINSSVAYLENARVE